MILNNLSKSQIIRNLIKKKKTDSKITSEVNVAISFIAYPVSPAKQPQLVFFVKKRLVSCKF